MSRNGSGTYSLPVNSWNPATNGVSATAADWQSLVDDIETALTASLAADGQTPMTGNLPMGNNKLTGLAAGTAAGNSLRWEQLFSQGVEADIASATTTDIGAQNTNFLRVTGNTTITGFGTNYNGPRFLRFAGTLTLTHGSALVLPGGANITTAVGDIAVAIPKATAGTPDGWVVIYQVAVQPYALKGANTDITSLNAPALGAATATTQSAGDNTTKVATTAFVTAATPAASTTVSGLVELANTSETQAGTDATRAVTPSGLANALLFSNGFESGEQTVTPNSVLSVAHGFSDVPKLVQVVLRCLSAEHGYSVGDEVDATFVFVSGVSVIRTAADTTNVLVIYDGASTQVPNKSTRAASTITSASWRFVVRAWG